MNSEQFEVGAEYEGERLDKYLGLLFEQAGSGLSRSFFQKLIKEGHVRVNDVTRKANYRLRADELITVEIPDAVETPILPENIPLDILYEDEDVLIVNKPKGMVVHPSSGHSGGTLVNAVMYHCRDSLSGINGEIRPGIVHRIDMDTTGSLIVCKNDESHVCIAAQIKAHSVTRKYRGIVYGRVKDDCGKIMDTTGSLIVCKNDESHVCIAAQIKAHSVTRKYRGIVYGRVKDDCGKIDAPIGRHPIERKKMAINEKNGKCAVTHYRVLERFTNYTYMEFELETGRTHQIRVHMASIGHPLLGDKLYSNGKSPYKLCGQTLHAMTIGFLHPSTGEYLEITAPLPEYFEKILRDFSNGKSPYKLCGQTLHAMTIGFLHPSTGEYLEITAPLPEYFEKILRDLRNI